MSLMKPWYRGKNKENNRWVYGWYFEIDNIPYIITKDNETFQIDITTLGLCTGRLDLNDCRLCEGDVISDGSKLYQILFDYDQAGFVFKDKKRTTYTFSEIYGRGIRLFSNIHDSPHHMMA